MTGLAADFRYALRTLRRGPGYAALCIAALALGIGANGAIFSLVDALMLRPLPYPQPQRLVMPFLHAESPAGGAGALGPDHLPWSYPKFTAFAREQRALSAVAAFSDDSANLTGMGEPERLQLEMVSPSYLRILGVRPLLGRGLLEDDLRADAPVVALVGEGLWRRRFGADRAVLGRVLRLNRVAVTVVGVLPAGFSGLSTNAELWVPISAAAQLSYPESLTEAGNHFLEAVGRLRPGVTAVGLAAEMRRVGKVVADLYPTPKQYDDGSRWSAGAQPLEEARRDPFVRRALLVLLGAVGAVLLIACANVAGLAMVRATGRRRDTAVRLAVGASGRRLVRQSLVESLVLALAGAGAGVVLAAWLVQGLAAIRPEALGSWGVGSAELHDLAHAGVDSRVLAFALLLAAVSALCFGIAPALAVRRASPLSDLRQGGGALRGAGGYSGHRRFTAPSQLLVAGQTALALVLLLGAGLLLRSFWSLQHVRLGFAPARVLSFAIQPPEGEFHDSVASGAFHRRLLERLAALPGVRGAAVGTCPPASNRCNSTRVLRLDGLGLERASAPRVGAHMVSADYFRTLGIPILRGRAFDDHDRAGAPRVAIVSESAAHQLWPGRDPLGHRLQIGMGGLRGEDQAEVVGVAADVRYDRLEDVPQPQVFQPDLQGGWPMTTVFVRTAGDPLAALPGMRAAVLSVDPDLPIYRLRTLDELLGFALSKARFGSLLLVAFAALAVFLAGLGVYGVLSQSVAARRRELGLRMALGARSADVQRLVLRQGLTMAVAGALVGVALSLATTGVLRSLLYAVPPRDPWTFAAAPCALLVVAALACLLPARRAARVDPAVVLQQE